MTEWTSDELAKIEKADELNLSSLRRDGSYRNPVIMWVVRVDDDLYVRCVNGRKGAWFRGTQTRHEGQIRAGGVVKDVSFMEDSDPAVNEKINDAYRTKYRRYAASIINSVISTDARSATIKLVPRA